MVKEKETKDTKKKATVKKENNKKELSKTKTTKKADKKVQSQKIGLFKRIGNWFKSVFKEISKVKWPSKKEMIKYSVATIVFVVFFSLFFYVIELLMAFIKSLI